MKIEFQTVPERARVTETWTVDDVPDHLSRDLDALKDLLYERMHAGEAEFVSEEVDEEEDRSITRMLVGSEWIVFP